MADETKTATREENMGPPALPANWADMSGDEKFAYYTEQWLSIEGRSFASRQIAEKYQRRARRLLDVVALKEPDRVPVLPAFAEYVLEHAGLVSSTHFYDPDKAARAAIKFHQDFDCDYSTIEANGSGHTLDILECRFAKWPGSKLANPIDEGSGYQYVESEYMKAHEYDELIGNPEGWLARQWLPRVFGGLEGLSMLPGLFNMIELPGVSPTLAALAFGPLRQTLENLLKAADHAAAYYGPFMNAGEHIASQLGVPTYLGGCIFAPYDMLGDTLRGTTPMMMDMFRRPDKVIAACEALVPLSVQIAVQAVEMTRIPFVMFPLHKGADGFMSGPQFEKFYWPTLKAQILALIDNGIIPLLFVEGGYDQRIDIIAKSDIPAGKTMWWFDRTDMQVVKKKLGDRICIGGGVPASMFMVSTPQEMDGYCKTLMGTAGKGGGFFLAPGAIIDQAKPENVHAYLSSSKACRQR